jgi:hypothetical protein
MCQKAWETSSRQPSQWTCEQLQGRKAVWVSLLDGSHHRSMNAPGCDWFCEGNRAAGHLTVTVSSDSPEF